ncbi:MAG: S41 family peptidase [Chloroflexi bacterium]|nr:S41 family peptidase [Chloroflexota bacterium]
MMKQSFRAAVGLILLITLTFSAGYFIGHDTTQPQSVVQAQGDDATEELFAPFWETWTLLHDNYIDPLDDDALMEAALNGMIDSLEDPHMGYIPPVDYQEVLDSLNGEFEGIGATVSQDEVTGALEIVRPLPGSPAEAAGLLPGDHVVTVDGEDITDMDQSVIISMVRGPAGTDVVLGIERAGEADVLEITVTRDRILLPSVDYEILDGNVGYLQLFQFGPTSNEELRDALIEMEVEDLSGLILDLRGNTGGYLDVTLDIISYFVEDGLILIEEDAEDRVEYQAFGNPVAPTVPMVVLVDQGSASASELMAGALQDRGRATVIGVPTFGKGSVQTWRRLSNGGGVRITISQWLTPSGYSVTPDGIQPDIVVEFPDLEPGTPYSQDIDTQLQAAIEALIEKTAPRAKVIP